MTDWDGMSEDEIRAHRARRKAKNDAALIDHLKQSMVGVRDYSWPPDPNTAHPGLERHSAVLRERIAQGECFIRIVVPTRLTARWYSDPEDVDLEVPRCKEIALNVRRAYGPAPYVGDPFVYMWRYAEDENKRWVAGDSWPEPVPPWAHVRPRPKEQP